MDYKNWVFVQMELTELIFIAFRYYALQYESISLYSYYHVNWVYAH